MTIALINRIKESLEYRYTTSSSDRFIEFLRKKGCRIGHGCRFHVPRTITVDVTRPCLITIGNNVNITKGVTILTHGADWHVLKMLYSEPFASAGAVTIKDNVFVGMNSIILMGVSVNENSIIGAGSVVTKDVPPRSVVAGNPAKKIMSIEDYYVKRKEEMPGEACNYAHAIRQRFNRLPVPEDFKEFYFLFFDTNLTDSEIIRAKKHLGHSYRQFLNSNSCFDSFQSFLRHCNLI